VMDLMQWSETSRYSAFDVHPHC